MNIQKIEITKLKPAEYNPRKDLKPEDEEYQKIKKSIIEFGYVAPIIVNSDMTVIGGHQRLKVLKELGYNEVECVIVDLNKNKEKALNIALNKISGDWDNSKLEELLAELKETDIDLDITGFSFDEVDNILKDITGSKEDDFDIQQALDEIDEPTTKTGDIWILGRQDYQWRHEPILYGWKEGAGHYFVDDRKQSTVLEFDKPSRNAEHPTMKPVDLLVYLIKNSSKEDNLILDLFGGSGSTLIAAEQTKRKCYTMELDPKYCDVIVKRWETLTGEKAELQK